MKKIAKLEKREHKELIQEMEEWNRDRRDVIKQQNKRIQKSLSKIED